MNYAVAVKSRVSHAVAVHAQDLRRGREREAERAVEAKRLVWTIDARAMSMVIPKRGTHVVARTCQ